MNAVADPPDAPETTDKPADIPGEKKAINQMADKFKAAMGKIAPEKPATPPKPPQEASKPATPAAVPVTPEKPPVAPAGKQNEPPVAAPATPPKPESDKEKNFRALEASRDQYKAEAEALKTAAAERDQLKAELEAAKKGSAEHEELRKQLEESQKFIDQFYIENSPQFRSHFGKRMEAAVLDAVEAVGPEQSEKIKEILELPPSKYRNEQIDAVAADLTGFKQAALAAAYSDLKAVERERVEELKKATENRKKLQELQGQQSKEQEAKAFEQRTAFANTVITKEVEPELQGVDATLAKEIRENIQKAALGQQTAEEFVATLRYATKGRKYEPIITAQQEKITKLEAQLAELQGANPSLTSSPATPSTNGKPGELEAIGPKFRRLRDQAIKGQ